MSTIPTPTSQSSQAGEPPCPSMSDLRGDGLPVRFVDATRRLFWSLEGDFLSAISVMKTALTPDSLEPLFQPDPSGGSSGTWHEICQLALTTPKVSSVRALVYRLQQYHEEWMGWHREHPWAEYITYGEMSDTDRPFASEMHEDGSWEEDSDTEWLVSCCGEERPINKNVKLEVKPAEGCQFVTILDFVSAVHSWLLSLREDILMAKRVARGYPSVFATEFMVQVDADGTIQVMDRENWIKARSGAPQNKYIPEAMLERMRKARELREREARGRFKGP
ncbi:hypothetical protein DL95DRAFT_407211 [Leptodontidium sp. 2 PMI_412]|nr:hypothetical protein DL95DRAFT_407211 [Leptodontidium sp. 2 PMI_412]